MDIVTVVGHYSSVRRSSFAIDQRVIYGCKTKQSDPFECSDVDTMITYLKSLHMLAA